jgi:phosphoribosylformylglycinamidine (FGAM) synthase-like amidotransferase family enzyme
MRVQNNCLQIRLSAKKINFFKMPITNATFDYLEAFELAGVHTEFVVQKFSNRTMIVVTQFNKIG